MKHTIRLTIMFAVAFLALVSLATADVPQMINYQGRLTNSAGDGLSGTYSMEFAIYDDSALGATKWAETLLAVTVADGLFNVVLGAIRPIDDSVFNQSNRWLGITVGADPELSPRTRLVSVGYSHRVSTVDRATGGIITGDVAIQSDLDVDGNLGVTGRATIGSGHTGAGSWALVAGTGHQVYASGVFVGGGSNNRVDSDNSTVSGGINHMCLGSLNTIGGGEHNWTNGTHATAVGGNYTYANADYAFAGGGDHNQAQAIRATVVGGGSNSAWGENSFIGGGTGNTTDTTDACVVGGQLNRASGYQSFVGSGVYNTASGIRSFVGGGYEDTASGVNSVVAGGFKNRACSTYSTVGGGSGNLASHYNATVAGGINDTAKGLATTISGGAGNKATGDWATVGGGTGNTAGGQKSTVAGGGNNNAENYGSFIGGGDSNTVDALSYGLISGGLNNHVQGYCCVIGGGRNNYIPTVMYSCIPGGDSNYVSSNYSMAFGHKVDILMGNTVTFFDGTNWGRLSVNRDSNDGLVLNIPFRVGTSTSNGNGAYLTAGGTWTNGSSREFKENFQQLDGQDVLNRIDALPIESWEYKGTGERHIWPCAEDFHEQFNVGILKDGGTRDVKYLAAGDVAGVALVGVQELYRMVKDHQVMAQELKSEKHRIEQLETQIAQLEALVETILARQDGSDQPKVDFSMSK